MFMELKPKFTKGQLVRLRHKTNTYIGKALVQYPKGEVLVVDDTFPNVSAADCKEAWDEGGEIIEPVYIVIVCDPDGNKFKVYEDEVKRAKVPVAIDPEDGVYEETVPSEVVKQIPIRKTGNRPHLRAVE